MTTSLLTKPFYLDALRREGGAFRAALTPDTLDRPVPPCPKWTMEDLAAHLGVIYHWQRTHLVRGVTSKPEHERPEPPDGVAVIDWWQDAFDQMVTALERVEPDMPAWNWTVHPQTAIFWHRRMAHETAVHRWDAQASVSLPEPVETQLAKDGVHEVLDAWLPAGRRKGPSDRHGVVRLQATDDKETWVVRVRGEVISVVDTDTVFDDPPAAEAAASGTASDLLLALWGRVPLSVLTIDGDPELVSSLRTG
ncbi:MAG TPA: maleylpyruvate isomerase family mycothiol-dependent enzyme [Cryptosporangiaceae bacterium]|nr:maleylpyruvate isomerase family mycothiol-dependent enzyme [Cryptosporangiaceae bacterium]